MGSAVDFHSTIADDFDAKYKTSREFIERYQIWSSYLQQHLKPTDTVLDAGCGSGVFSFLAAQLCQSVVGVDGSQGMLKLCEEKRTQKKVSNVTFYEHYLPLPTHFLANQRFDAIISSSVLEYIQDWEKCVADFNTRLKDNGLLIVSMPNYSGIYRKLERVLFSTTGYPKFLHHVPFKDSVSIFDEKMNKAGFVKKSFDYFANDRLTRGFLVKVLPAHLTHNLFIAVYQKNNGGHL